VIKIVCVGGEGVTYLVIFTSLGGYPKYVVPLQLNFSSAPLHVSVHFYDTEFSH